ncbi:MAG: GGDEF domain-containing protein [Gammaproteobacteria bacterium]|nr:GGDEF domain-containing protein [Gammaproteobacteria bacterium]
MDLGSIKNKNVSTANSISIQKVLHILGVIRSLPSGALIHQQIEQILLEYDNQQIHVEHVYVRLLQALLDIFQSRIPEESSLIIRLKLLQARLQPPLLMHDIGALESEYKKCLTEVVQMLGSPASRVGGAAHTEVLERGQGLGSIETLSEILMEDDETAISHEFESKFSDSTSIKGVLEVKDKSGQEISELRDTLSHKLREAVQQNQDFCVMLDLTMSELQQANKILDINELKQQLTHHAGRLYTNSQRIVEALEGADQFLGNVEVDYKQLDEELSRARLLSMTDYLTELPNRRAFLGKLENEVGRIRRHNQPLTLAIIDLDKFKSINDQHGHAVGDEVLRCYASEVFSIFRQYDMVARFGGEEFAVLLPNTDKEGALRAMKKVKARVGQITCDVNGQSIPIPTFSAGLAVYNEGETLGAYIERADQAMYRAKSLGRDRVEFDNG